jgi:hypothetical protein
MVFLVLQTDAAAHSLQEIDRLFGDEAIPAELVELTNELDMTAGARTVREQAHAKQHEILEQYLQAHTERKCTESRTRISRLDLEIVALQEQGQHEEEQARRLERDETAAFIKKSCSATSLAE